MPDQTYAAAKPSNDMQGRKQTDEQQERAASGIREQQRLRTDRMNFESYWQEVSEYTQPSFSNTFFGNLIMQGQKKDQRRYDGTAEVALYRFSAVMESQLTPRGSRWHGLGTDDISLNRKRNVQLWFDNLTDVLFKYRYSPFANFASQCHEHYTGLGFLGTSAMFIDRMSSRTHPVGIRYQQTHIANVFFRENHQGIIDTVYRIFRMSARNAVQKFRFYDGSVDLPPDIIKAAAGDNPDQLFDFIHCIHPNENVDPSKKDWRGMNFRSYYIAKQSSWIIGESGYSTFPFAISRYTTAPGEIYGRSPAMQVLTNIKVLNQQKRTMIKQGQRVVDPVLLMHDDGVLDQFSLKPGSMNAGAINARGERMVDVLPTGNLSAGEDLMKTEKEEINAAFLVDLFQILVDGPQMTATEVVERAREKGALISPTMGRQESEFLGPLIEREIDLVMQQGLVGPMPPELKEAGGQYKIVYDNPLSRSQKAEQTAGIMRVVQWAAQVVQDTQDPSVMDHFNWDVIIPDLANNQAVPVKYMSDAGMLAQKRQARSQQQAIQQAIQAGPAVAGLAQKSPQQ